MKIDLREIKILEENSEETLCFSARLYINGAFAATVHNNGQGEANRYTVVPQDPMDHLLHHFTPLRCSISFSDKFISHCAVNTCIGGEGYCSVFFFERN